MSIPSNPNEASAPPPKSIDPSPNTTPAAKPISNADAVNTKGVTALGSKTSKVKDDITVRPVKTAPAPSADTTQKNVGIQSFAKKTAALAKDDMQIKYTTPSSTSKKQGIEKIKMDSVVKNLAASTEQHSNVKPPMNREITSINFSNKTQLSGQSDLKTPQGRQANAVAFTTQACLMSAMANADTVGIQKAMNLSPTPQNTPKEKFKVLSNCIGEVIKAAELNITKRPVQVNDPTDTANAAELNQTNRHPKDDCKLLNELAFLIQKGFVPNGGVGCFQNPGWNEEWGKIGNMNAFKWDEPTDLSWKDAGITLSELKGLLGKNDLTEKDLDQKISPAALSKMEQIVPPVLLAKVNAKLETNNNNNKINNQALIKSFESMMKYFAIHTDSHFNPATRHLASVELVSVLVSSTLGQIVHDFLLEVQKMKSGATLLKSQMLAHGLIKNSAAFDELTVVEKRMRSNPLLAEVPNDLIKKDLAETLKGENATHEKMMSFLKDELIKCDKTIPKMNPQELNNLANKVLEKFLEELKSIPTSGPTSGSRGRAPMNLKFLGEHIAGAKGEVHSFAIMPNREDDRLATNLTKTLLRGNNKIGVLAHAIDGNAKILAQGKPPTNILRLDTGLDSGFSVLLEDPAELLKAAIKKVVPENEKQKVALHDLGSELTKSKDNQNKSIEKIIGEIPVTFNTATGQTMNFGDMAKMKSVASILYNNNLRTICSISGTTVDIMVGLTLSVGKENMGKLLEPLLKYVEKLVEVPQIAGPSPLNTPEGLRFKEVFSSIAFFMQSGKFHTAAEVLGGLLIFGRGLTCTENDNKDIQKTYKMFERLMEEFSKHPENFISVNEADKREITDPTKLGQVLNEFEKQEMQRINQHKDTVAKVMKKRVRS